MRIGSHPLLFRIVFALLMLASLTVFGLSVILPRLLDLNRYQTQLTNLLQTQLHRPVHLGNSHFTWVRGPAFSFDEPLIQERNGQGQFLTARRISFRLALLPLLTKQIKLREIVLDGARISLSRSKEGLLNIDDLIKPTGDSYDLEARSIRIVNSTLFWRDAGIGATPLTVTLSGINFTIDRLKRGKKSTFKLSAVVEGNSPNRISSSGSFWLPKTGSLLHQTDCDLKGELDRLEYWRFWPYLGNRAPFPSPGGTISTRLTLKGRWHDLEGKVWLAAEQPRVVWPTVFRQAVSSRTVTMGSPFKWTTDELTLSKLKLDLDNFSLKGTLRLAHLNSKDPSINVEAVTEPFDYQKVKHYIPFGIIAEDAAEFIEQRIRGGIFRLTTGTLNGRFSQLAKFGIGDNANSLYIKGTADQAVIQYGETTPTFRQIKGVLEMKGHNFNLIGMSGNFGDAPFTLDGSITDYATEGVSSQYPFSMTITPKPGEVAWAAGHAGVEELQFYGSTTTLKLQGDGPVQAYRVSGDWQLNQAAYNYPAVVSKPAGMANTLQFSAVLGRDDTRFTSITYQLPPLKITGNGLLRYSDHAPYLAFDLATNQFLLDHHLPILTTWKEYQLHGTSQAHLVGAGDPRSINTMQFSGNVKLTGFSFKPHQNFDPVTNISTRIDFKGQALQTSSMAIRYGSTPLQIRGRINNLSNPEAELYITSPELNPVDFGLPTTEQPTPIKQFSAQLALKDDLLTIRNISGKLPKSVISASGTVNTASTPDFNLRIACSYLDVDEIIPLLAPAKPAENDIHAAPAPFHLQAHITAEKGSYLGAPLSKLTSYLATESGVLHLKGLNTGILGGKLSLQGDLTRVAGQPPRWNTTFLLEQARAGDVLELLGIRREIKGKTMAQGTITAVGSELDEIKKTANGVITLAVERGTLKRFNTLSKVISIINVSQLLRFSLPDMAKDGMPFNRITASIGITNGVMTTRDFFIDSNVMHVTTVGSIDLVKETLDMQIGVQPLQTVDKVVSRIPVVGWILSGGDGSLITTYFDAKGSWDDPQVTAVPVQTLATGTFDIFRRILELPVRLFTNTGEVVLGNQQERPKAVSPQNSDQAPQ